MYGTLKISNTCVEHRFPAVWFNRPHRVTMLPFYDFKISYIVGMVLEGHALAHKEL